MLPLYRITILILFLPLMGLSQDRSSPIDSLINIYETTTSHQTKLRIGQGLADSLLWIDGILAKKYGLETFPLARVSDDPLLKSYGYFLFHIHTSDDPNSAFFNEFTFLDSSEMILNASFGQEKPEKAHKLHLLIHNARGLSFYNKGELDKAIKNYHKALTIAKEQQLDGQIALINFNISICHYSLTNYQEALIQLEETYDYSIKIGDNMMAADALHIIGATYQELDSLAKAKMYVAKAISLSKEIQHQQAYREALLSMGLIHEDLNDLDSALYYLEFSLEETVGQNATVIEAQIYQSMARVASKKGNSKQARSLFKKAVALNNEVDRKDTHYELAIDIAGMEYLDKNYKEAYDLLKVGYFKKDSFTSLENRAALTELALKYGKAEDEKLIAEQKLTLANKQKKITYLTGGFLFSFLGFLTFYAFYQNSKRRRELVQKELAYKNIEIETMEKEKSILALTNTLEGQEAERSRIAQDLHDGLGGLLSAVKAHYGKIQKEINHLESMKVFDTAEGMLDNACEEVRRISHNLMPPLLRSQGLVSAFTGLFSSYRSEELKIEFDPRNMETRLEDTQEVFIYRIAQELLTNIVKHAKASKVEVSLYGLDDMVQLIIEDNGVGFSEKEESEGLGLFSIRSRVEYLKGDLEIDSTSGEGSTISISIPRKMNYD